MTIQNVKQVQVLVEVADEEIEEELELTGATIADPYITTMIAIRPGKI